MGNLHNATEGKDHQISHSEEKSEIRKVIENVVKGISIHCCEACKDRRHEVPVSVRIPEERESKKSKSKKYWDHTSKSSSYYWQSERYCSSDQ